MSEYEPLIVPAHRTARRITLDDRAVTAALAANLTASRPPVLEATRVLVTRRNEWQRGTALVIGVDRQPDQLVAVSPEALAEEGDLLRFGPAPAPHELVDPTR
jgi:hypothetical protein